MPESPMEEATRELKHWREVARHASEQVVVWYELKRSLMEDKFATFTDAEILADEKLALEFFQLADTSSYANKRAKKMISTGKSEMPASMAYPKDDDYSRLLPCVELWFIKDQEVTDLAEILTEWASRFAYGREVITVRIMEHSLSEYTSYRMEWNIAEGTAKIQTHRSWGEAEAEGTLEECLMYIAKNLWYERAGGSSSTYEDRDDY